MVWRSWADAANFKYAKVMPIMTKPTVDLTMEGTNTTSSLTIWRTNE